MGKGIDSKFNAIDLKVQSGGRTSTEEDQVMKHIGCYI